MRGAGPIPSLMGSGAGTALGRRPRGQACYPSAQIACTVTDQFPP